MTQQDGADRTEERDQDSRNRGHLGAPGSVARASDVGTPAGPIGVLLVTASGEVKQQVLLILRRLDYIKPLGASRRMQEAQRWIEALQPDAVLLHVAASDGAVLSLLPTIRDLPSPPVVVVLSEESSDTLKQHCRDGGAQVLLDLTRPECDGLPSVLAALWHDRRYSQRRAQNLEPIGLR
jgi:CheY-like chemotaxis protein